MREEYYSEECNIPSLDDPIADFEINGTSMYFDTFYDVVKVFGIDNDVRFEAE